MKTIEIKVKDKEYTIGRMNAKDASFIAITMIVPLLASLEEANASGNTDILCKILKGLSKDEMSKLSDSLFEEVKLREHNVLCSVFKSGQFMYEDILDDYEIYLSLLKASVELSFGDFLASAGRVFPKIGEFQAGLAGNLKPSA